MSVPPLHGSAWTDMKLAEQLGKMVQTSQIKVNPTEICQEMGHPVWCIRKHITALSFPDDIPRRVPRLVHAGLPARGSVPTSPGHGIGFDPEEAEYLKLF